MYGKGDAAGRDIDAELGPVLKARDAALQARIVAARSPRATPEPVEAQPVRSRFLKQLAAAAPAADLRGLTRPPAKAAGQAAFCRGIIAMFRTAAAMDPKSAGVALSQVLGGAR